MEFLLVVREDGEDVLILGGDDRFGNMQLPGDMGIPGADARPDDIVARLQDIGSRLFVVGSKRFGRDGHGDNFRGAGGEEGSLPVAFQLLVGLVELAGGGGDIDLHHLFAGIFAGVRDLDRNLHIFPFHRNDVVGEFKRGVAEAESERIERLDPVAVEIPVAGVNPLFVNRNRAHVIANAAVCFLIKAIGLVGQDGRRVVLIKAEVGGGGMVLVIPDDGRGELAGGGNLAHEDVRQGRGPLLAGGNGVEDGLDVRVLFGPGEVDRADGILNEDDVGKGRSHLLDKLFFRRQQGIVLFIPPIALLAA